jgi:hypothetical protein
VTAGGAALGRLARDDLSGLDSRLEKTSIVLASDVEPDLTWYLAEPGPLARRLASAIDLNPP